MAGVASLELPRLGAPVEMGLAFGGRGFGFMTRVLDATVGQIMQPAGPEEFGQELRAEDYLKQLEADAEFLWQNINTDIAVVKEFGFLAVGEGVLDVHSARRKGLVTDRTLQKATDVAHDVKLVPDKLAPVLERPRIKRLDRIMESSLKVRTPLRLIV